MTDREKYVFNRLVDERSRQVFRARQDAVKYYPVDFFAYNGLFNVIQEFADINEYHSQTPLESVIAEFAARNNKFIFYGAGRHSVIIAEKLSSFNNRRFNDCIGVWVINPFLGGKNLFGIPIVTPPPPPMKNIDMSGYSEVEVLVTQYTSVILNEIITYLLTMGFKKEHIVTLEKFAPKECNYAEFEPFKHAYNEEIFVDGGCLNFNSSMEFLQNCLNAKKIYAFEPNPDTNVLDRIRRNIMLSGFKNVILINAALWSENTRLSFNTFDNTPGLSSVRNGGKNLVNAVALDSVVEPDENISFIKLDVEGAENEALKGMNGTIRRCRPKLAICIYHKAYDYVDIPEYILSLVPEYKIYMRHYTDTYFESIMFAMI
jgi:FkbM family methyltransferase